jgi:hypothetical protein
VLEHLEVIELGAVVLHLITFQIFWIRWIFKSQYLVNHARSDQKFCTSELVASRRLIPEKISEIGAITVNCTFSILRIRWLPGRRFESYRHRLVSPGDWAMASNVSSSCFFGPKVTLFRAESHTFSGRKSRFFGPKVTAVTLFRAETFRAEFRVAHGNTEVHSYICSIDTLGSNKGVVASSLAMSPPWRRPQLQPKKSLWSTFNNWSHAYTTPSVAEPAQLYRSKNRHIQVRSTASTYQRHFTEYWLR